MAEVSVIIPVYNTEPWLKECLQSVCCQTLRDIEIICINDGSTDRSLAILQEFAERDERIVIINHNNRGISYARNTGMNRAKGKYIFFLDSDDFLAYDAMEILAGEMRKKNLEILFFDVNVISEEGVDEKWLQGERRYFARFHEYPSKCKGEELYRLFRTNNEYITPVYTMLLDRAFLLGHSLAFLEGIMHEDELFTSECLLLASDTGYLDRKLYNRRIREGSLMDLQRSDKKTFSVFSCFMCVKHMLQFCHDLEYQKENEEILSSEVDRLIGNCHNRYEKLDEKERSRVLELTGKDRFLFKALVLTSFDRNEIIKGLRKEVRKKTEIIKETESESQKRIDFLEQENSRVQKKLSQMQEKSVQADREMNNIKGGWSFRIGRTITFIPRRIKKLLKK